LAILIGNVYAYIVSPKSRLVLRLKEKVRIAPDIYDFVFAPTRKFSFAPGQYMEWTLGHDNVDSRGNRRYFTLASAPGEHHLRLGVKFYKNSSSFKKAMLAMEKGQEITAAQLDGEFVLPRDPRQKCVFIAGGIGITPFRSMLKHLLDNRQKRPITVFYANKTADEIVYKDVLDRAEQELGIKTIYSLTDAQKLPANWAGQVGRVSPQVIRATVPQYKDCLFYISGSREMVDSFKSILKGLGVSGSQVKTDYFPGLA
jgi:ferredoxin-NADP reductase